MENKNSQIVIYKDKNGQIKIDVRFDGDTVWLTQNALGDLFQTTKQNISQHIKNIIKESELIESATVKEFFTVQKEGDREVERGIVFYNLDMIIAVGYRTKSSIATAFRKWATGLCMWLEARSYKVKSYKVKSRNPMNFIT